MESRSKDAITGKEVAAAPSLKAASRPQPRHLLVFRLNPKWFEPDISHRLIAIRWAWLEHID
eukprot:1147809-Rhodomonas_salina.1